MAGRLDPLRRMTYPLECWVGGQISEQICRHHRRRLGRIGWSHALEPEPNKWAAGEFPARPGNSVEILIDGAQALDMQR